MFDWTINLGHIITIVTVIIGAITYITVIKDKVDDISKRLIILELEMKRLIDVLIEQGRQDERIDSIDARSLAQGQRIDDLTRKLDRFFEIKS